MPQATGQTSTPQSSPHSPIVDYYPGIGVQSNNPTVFVCSRANFYFAPHPTNCQKYFICSNGQIHEHQCGYGVHWDHIQSQCEFAERAKCFARNQHQQQDNDSIIGNIPANQEIVDDDNFIDVDSSFWPNADGEIDAEELPSEPTIHEKPEIENNHSPIDEGWNVDTSTIPYPSSESTSEIPENELENEITNLLPSMRTYQRCSIRF